VNIGIGTIRLLPHLDYLVLPHYEELAKNKGLMVLAPDWERFNAIEDAGKLLTLYATEQGKVVGYSVSVIDTHIHYKHLTLCANDLLYVAPGQRGTVGLKLMSETERIAKELGAQIMLWHAKTDSPLNRIFLAKHKRYAVQDIIYSTPL
jgi:hypothetical protein